MPSSLVTKVVHRGVNSELPSCLPRDSTGCTSAATAERPPLPGPLRTTLSTPDAAPHPPLGHGGLHGVGDDIGQLTVLSIDPALRGRASATLEHGGEQLLDDVELAVLSQHRRDVIE